MRTAQQTLEIINQLNAALIALDKAWDEAIQNLDVTLEEPLFETEQV